MPSLFSTLLCSAAALSLRGGARPTNGTSAWTLESIGYSLTAMTQQLTVLEKENAELKRSIAKSSGELTLFVDGRVDCPAGSVEVNTTQGFILTGRPKGGETGATFNRAFDAKEQGRSAPHVHTTNIIDKGHAHESGVVDPGHKHVITLKDPGHKHSITITDPGHIHRLQQGDKGQKGGSLQPDGQQQQTKFKSDAAKTGITASAATVSTGITATSTGSPTGVGVQVKPSKTSILVNVNKNVGGEYEPLVYVLVCQQL